MKYDGFLFVFLLSSRLRLSFVSVTFDFNDSNNDFTPGFSMSFPVVMKRKEKRDYLIDAICVPSFFCLHDSDRVQ